MESRPRSTPGRYAYGKLTNYSRLSREDSAIWEEYISRFPNRKWQMDYDVKVGLGRQTLDDIPPKLKKDWYDLTRKRIDAVAWAPDKIFIIELKPKASLSAIGQVLGYSELWEDIHDNSRLVKPMIICRSSDPDTNRVARRAGVLMRVLSPLES